MLITKADGSTQEFDPHKLTRSLKRAGATEREVSEVLGEIQRGMVPGMTTHAIFERAFAILRDLGKMVANKYSLRRGIIELGPTGFPFEDYIARLLTAEGYTVSVRNIAQGDCAQHEIDVAGFRGEETFIAEVKFHADPSYKSDLQVVLYSYARLLDLQHWQVHPQAPQGVKLLKIITNTKFTLAATEYAACKGIELLSWGYPDNEHSLEMLIEKHHLLPVTILSSLTPHQKMLLIQRGVVTCKDLIRDESALHALNMPHALIAQVVEEARGVC